MRTMRPAPALLCGPVPTKSEPPTATTSPTAGPLATSTYETTNPGAIGAASDAEAKSAQTIPMPARAVVPHMRCPFPVAPSRGVHDPTAFGPSRRSGRSLRPWVERDGLTPRAPHARARSRGPRRARRVGQVFRLGSAPRHLPARPVAGRAVVVVGDAADREGPIRRTLYGGASAVGFRALDAAGAVEVAGTTLPSSAVRHATRAARTPFAASHPTQARRAPQAPRQRRRRRAMISSPKRAAFSQ